jgi:hypothetical protein
MEFNVKEVVLSLSYEILGLRATLRFKEFLKP